MEAKNLLTAVPMWWLAGDLQNTCAYDSLTQRTYPHRPKEPENQSDLQVLVASVWVQAMRTGGLMNGNCPLAYCLLS